MMHSSTVREVKLLRQIITNYHPHSDEQHALWPAYYNTLTVKSISVDEGGEVKIAVMRELLRKLGLKVKIYSWIGGRMIIDIELNPKIQPDAQEQPYADTSVRR